MTIHETQTDFTVRCDYVDLKGVPCTREVSVPLVNLPVTVTPERARDQALQGMPDFGGQHYCALHRPAK